MSRRCKAERAERAELEPAGGAGRLPEGAGEEYAGAPVGWLVGHSPVLARFTDGLSWVVVKGSPVFLAYLHQIDDMGDRSPGLSSNFVEDGVWQVSGHPPQLFR